jgi:pilus assembly protein FimV
MQKLLRLCLWQALIISISCFSLPIFAQEGGIQIRGPKSTDAFPYDRYGPITIKDTLWNIALKVRPDPRLSVYQVMQALYENNPNAFQDNNLNHMINGQYLKIPSIGAMRAVNSANAQQKSRSDDKVWQEKVVNIVATKAKRPEDMSVNKKDLETAKSEINVQLKAIDSTQQQRLATIQNDVLDSIDGLQSLLKENEGLRQRLTNFNDQLDVMQNEVAKGKEIKMQMDDMIALQQELLTKAEAREQALLLKEQSVTSSSWFVALMATLPAILVLSLIAMVLRRRSGKTEPVKDVPTAKKKVPEAAIESTQEPEPAAELLDSELSLDDELSLDGELSLDDELSIDLSESDEEHDDIFSDDLDSLDDQLLDDEVIQLDDDLDELDDLEDISLDDDMESISLDDELTDEVIEDETLEGGQLDQGDLDSLLAGLDTEVVENESSDEVLEGGVLDQGDLDSLLADDDLEEEGSGVSDEGSAVLNDPDDIDALLDAVDSDMPEADASTEDMTQEVSDPDDIDALLDSMGTGTSEVDASTEDMTQEVSDPDDIDALLDSMEADTPALDVSAEDMTQDVSDPDDIDALLDAIGADTPEPEISKEDMTQDVSDPDDIDALLDAIGGDTPESEISKEDMTQDVSDPDDIDALLDAIGADTPESEISKEDMTQDVSDPDDIDALLDAIGVDTPELDTDAEDMTQDVTDPDDIDALLDAMGDDLSTPEESMSNEEDTMQEISDPDDIDALLNEMAGEKNQPHSVDIEENETIDSQVDSSNSDADIQHLDNENIELINNFTDKYVQSFLNADFSDLLNESDENKTAEESSVENVSGEMSDEFDIDSLIDEVNQSAHVGDDSSFDIGDDLLDTDILDLDLAEETSPQVISDEVDSFIDDETLQELSADFDESTLTQLLNDEQEADTIIELSPDFTDSNVLADLLADDNPSSSIDSDAEVDGIKELDNLDFDDLLANIEEEASSTSIDEFELDDTFDIGDDLEIGATDEVAEDLEKDNAREDFISVDSLMSDSLLDGKQTEPYEKMNVDVGLGEFPEFAGNVGEEDIDDDDNGMAAKLDLAKVYIEIGDNENAEVILLDVVNQGDAQQQFDAQQLLDNI